VRNIPRIPRRIAKALTVAGLVTLLSASAPLPAHARVDVLMSPATQTVAPGSEFEIQFQVTNPSPHFNAFHMIVTFDPGALTPVKLSPVGSQLGPVVTDSCGNNVNWFHMGASSDTIDVSMLCAGASNAGPGMIYRTHFRASSTPQTTALRVLPDVQFANAGILLDSIYVTGGVIGIGMPPPPLGVSPPAGGALRLTASPNPARGEVGLDFGRPLSAGGMLAILDVQGRVLRRIELGVGARAYRWDGRDGSGLRVPPGLYLVALHVGGEQRVTRVTEVR
jgi:hypothetical protein